MASFATTMLAHWLGFVATLSGPTSLLQLDCCVTAHSAAEGPQTMSWIASHIGPEWACSFQPWTQRTALWVEKNDHWMMRIDTPVIHDHGPWCFIFFQNVLAKYKGQFPKGAFIKHPSEGAGIIQEFCDFSSLPLIDCCLPKFPTSPFSCRLTT